MVLQWTSGCMHPFFVFLIFISDCVGSPLLHGLFSSCSVQVCHWGAQALGCLGFSNCSTGAQSCSSQALEHRLNSCGSWTQLLCDMQGLPRSGIEPVSPTLAGGVFTAEWPGKPQEDAFDCNDQMTQLNTVSRFSNIVLHKVITDAWSFFLLSSTIHSISLVLGLVPFFVEALPAANWFTFFCIYLRKREKLPNLVLQSKEA